MRNYCPGKGKSLECDIPKISILLPNWNNISFLEERIESIFTQTFTDWELLILDGYSDDGSWEFFRKYEDYPKIHLYQEERKGVYTAWNSLIKKSKGEYVYIATSDDTMYPDCLRLSFEALESNPQIDICSMALDIIDDKSNIIPNCWETRAGVSFYRNYWKTKHIRNGIAEFFLHLALGTPHASITGLLIRKSLFEKTGLFQTDVGPIADREWEMTSCLFTDIICLPMKLATWRTRKNQVTQSIAPLERVDLFKNSFNRMLSHHRATIEQACGHSVNDLSSICNLENSYYRNRMVIADTKFSKAEKACLLSKLFFRFPIDVLCEAILRLLGINYIDMKMKYKAKQMIKKYHLKMPILV